MSVRKLFCSVLQPSSIRGLATPRTYFLHLSLSSVILTDSSTESPVHVLMLSIQAVRGLPRLRAPGIVPCVISFSRRSRSRRKRRRMTRKKKITRYQLSSVHSTHLDYGGGNPGNSLPPLFHFSPFTCNLLSLPKRFRARNLLAVWGEGITYISWLVY